MGSPPRMRGKGNIGRPNITAIGITPAYAGKRMAALTICAMVWDHPRVCGEKVRAGAFIRHKPGSPPRMRGKGKSYDIERLSQGITPAYAGKSRPRTPFVRVCWDHPRVCGEKCHVHVKQNRFTGSPPRMRGKGTHPQVETQLKGITPAYAGKRRLERSKHHETRDHPRVCGEKFTGSRFPPSTAGSPPRMRGKEARPAILSFYVRITPAYAGKRRYATCSALMS